MIKREDVTAGGQKDTYLEYPVNCCYRDGHLGVQKSRKCVVHEINMDTLDFEPSCGNTDQP